MGGASLTAILGRGQYRDRKSRLQQESSWLNCPGRETLRDPGHFLLERAGPGVHLKIFCLTLSFHTSSSFRRFDQHFRYFYPPRVLTRMKEKRVSAVDTICEESCLEVMVSVSYQLTTSTGTSSWEHLWGNPKTVSRFLSLTKDTGITGVTEWETTVYVNRSSVCQAIVALITV